MSHTSNLYYFWNAIVIFLCLASSIHYFILSSFRQWDHHEDNTHYWSMFTYELIFLLDFILQFFIDYHDNQLDTRIREMSKIASRYLNSCFAWDLIPLLPLQFLHLKNNRHNLFYVIKLLRLYRLSNLNTNVIMQILKKK